MFRCQQLFVSEAVREVCQEILNKNPALLLWSYPKELDQNFYENKNLEWDNTQASGTAACVSAAAAQLDIDFLEFLNADGTNTLSQPDPTYTWQIGNLDDGI